MNMCVVAFVVFGQHAKDTSHEKGDLEKMLAEHVRKNLDVAIKNQATQTRNRNETSEETQNNVQTPNAWT